MANGNETALITGAAGFIGSHLAERCLDGGMRVIAVDSLDGYYPEQLKRENLREALARGDYEFIHGDLLELDLAPLLSDVDVVFHLAAQPGVRASWGSGFARYTRQNLDAFQRLLEASVGTRIRRFVYASSSSVYGDAESFPTAEDVQLRPVSPYGMTKAAGEQLAAIYHRNFAVPTVGLRYFSVYGPRQRPDMAFNRLIGAAIHDEEFSVYGDGRQTRDFTFVRDVVAGTVAAGRQGRLGTVYNLGGGSRVSMLEVFGIVEEITGRKLRLRFEGRQRGDARDTCADVSRAASELDYHPMTSVMPGVQAQIEWQQAMMLDLA